jgi:hypothetical protein
MIVANAANWSIIYDHKTFIVQATGQLSQAEKFIKTKFYEFTSMWKVHPTTFDRTYSVKSKILQSMILPEF